MMKKPLHEDIVKASHFMLGENKNFSDLTPNQKYLRFIGLRRLGLTFYCLNILSKKKPSELIISVIAIAIALIDKKRYASHVIVSQSVEALKLICGRKTAGFGNFLLRKIMTDFESLSKKNASHCSNWNAPNWWIRHFKKQCSSKRIQNTFLESIDAHPPLTIRVNDLREIESISREFDHLNKTLIKVGPRAYTVIPPFNILKTEAFKGGKISVQDSSSQLISTLLQPCEESKVLDMCAAPGGKSLALATLHRFNLISNDKSGERMKKMKTEIVRLKNYLVTTPLTCSFDPLDQVGLMELQNYCENGFDYILLDAPCSASGLLRRHPEIPWVRTPSQLKNLILLQAKLLDASWTILRTGGILIYSTCSIFYNEGENQILKFLKRTKDAERKSAPGLVEPKIGIDFHEKLVTCTDKKNIRKDWLGNDGFFYAILKKKTKWEK